MGHTIERTSATAETVQLNIDYPKYNILVIVADDIGQEMLKAYDSFNRYSGDDPDAANLYPETPNIDALLSGGMLFRHVWAQPNCSPFRAGLYTGRYAFRTGTGTVVKDDQVSTSYLSLGRDIPAIGSTPSLKRREYVLPEVAKQAGYKSAIFGKWHLGLWGGTDSGVDSQNSKDEGTLSSGGSTISWEGEGWDHLDNYGKWDHWFCTFRNLDRDPQPYSDTRADGTYGVPSPTAGGFTPNGGWYGREKGDSASTLYNGEAQYAPTVKVDKALAWMNDVNNWPFVSVVPLNLVHTPFHNPPSSHVTTTEYTDAIASNPNEVWGYYMAMCEALDYEVGRLVDGLDAGTAARTQIFFVGDNGTPSGILKSARDAFGKDIGVDYDYVVDSGLFKNTIYRHGIVVPLIAKGPLVGGSLGRASSVPIDAHVDLFETMRHIMHTRYDSVAGSTSMDGQSFLPAMTTASVGFKRGRTTGLSERFGPNGDPTKSDVATDFKSRAYRKLYPSEGLYELIRETGTTDKLYRLFNSSSSHVDSFQKTPLDISVGGADRDKYVEMSEELVDLLTS